MHRQTQTAARTACSSSGLPQHLLAALQPHSPTSLDAGAAPTPTLQLAAWLVAHDHALRCATLALATHSQQPVARVVGAATTATIATLQSLASLVPSLGLFHACDAWVAQLKRGALAIQHLAGTSDISVAASALRTCGDLYRRFQRHDEAEPLLRDALATAQRVAQGGDSIDVAESLTSLGKLHQAQCRLKDAMALLVASLEMRQRLGTTTVTALSDLAQLFTQQGRPADALPLLTRLVELVDHDTPEGAWAMTQLASLHRHLLQFDKAEPLYAHALAVRRQQVGNNALAVAEAVSNLGNMYTQQRHFAEAAACCKEALELQTQAARGGASSGVAAAWTGIARLHMAQRQFDDAEAAFMKALEVQRCLPAGSDSCGVAQSLCDLGLLCHEQQRFADAVSWHAQALAMEQRLVGTGAGADAGPDTTTSISAGHCRALAHLGDVYVEQQRWEEAEPLYTQVLAAGTDIPMVAQACAGLGQVYDAFKRYHDAQLHSERALALQQQLSAGGDSQGVATALQVLAIVFESRKHFDTALEHATRAVDVLKRAVGDHDSRQLAACMHAAARMYAHESLFDKAEPLVEAAVAMQRRLDGDEDSCALARSLHDAGCTYKALRKRSRSLKMFYKSSGVLWRLAKAGDSEDVATAMWDLSASFSGVGDHDEAEELTAKALKIYQALAGPQGDSWTVAKALHITAHKLGQRRRYKQAHTFAVRTLEMMQRLAATDEASKGFATAYIGRAENDLARVLLEQQQYEVAETHFEAAVKHLKQQCQLEERGDTAEVAAAQNNLAMCYNQQKRYAEAAKLHQQALATRQRLADNRASVAVASSLNNLGVVLLRQEQYEEAETVLVQALAMRKQLHKSVPSWSIVRILVNLGAVYEAQGKTADARDADEQARAMQEQLRELRAPTRGEALCIIL